MIIIDEKQMFFDTSIIIYLLFFFIIVFDKHGHNNINKIQTYSLTLKHIYKKNYVKPDNDLGTLRF